MSAKVTLVLKFIQNKREAIIGQWYASTIQGCGARTASLLQQDPDVFRNPVGHTLKRNLPVLFDALLEVQPPESYQEALDSIVRIQAVQDSRASQAVSFVLALKGIVRDVLGDQPQLDPQGSGRAAFESRIDAMALRAFDLYVSCRERICEIKSNEVRRRAYISERMASRPPARSQQPL